MMERRGARGVRDIGVRTRRTDRLDVPSTPHGQAAWHSTFNLRWMDHLKHRPKDGDNRAA
ncbi:MAG TPA: hypothetical protein VMW11_05055 [Candidatus Dormibacteraeota bacterium]|nr:hypothetical protein [Candidatus Dormibacteraeota bacterium]